MTISEPGQENNNVTSSSKEGPEGDVMSEKENEAQAESVDSQASSANQLEIPDSNSLNDEPMYNAEEALPEAAPAQEAEQDEKVDEPCQRSANASEEDDEVEDSSADEPEASVEASAEAAASEDLDEAADDPLGEAYDLDKGERLPSDVHHDGKLPWKSKIESAKEFFNTEILYRHDILLAEERDRIAGSYRIELKGYQGGIWSVDVGDDIEVVNRREDADVVLAMQQKDFLRVVNGELNPQLALLSRKIKVTGDIKKAVALQSLLAPTME